VLLFGENDRDPLGASGFLGVVGLPFNLRIMLRVERQGARTVSFRRVTAASPAADMARKVLDIQS